MTNDFIREYGSFNIYIDPYTLKFYSDTPTDAGVGDSVAEVMREIDDFNKLTNSSLNLNKLKLHAFTVPELITYFDINREQALKFHHAIMADYDSIIKQIPTTHN